jgi:heat-inducible transcriptional repressor
MTGLQRKLQELIKTNLNYDSSLKAICNSVLNSIDSRQNTKIKVTGTSNLLRSPEFNEGERAHSLMNLFEKDDFSDQLSEILGNIEQSEPLILIGKEIKISQLEDCSLIVGAYNIGGIAHGTIGLLGPTRMQYGKSIAVIEEMTKYLNKVLSKIYGIE